MISVALFLSPGLGLALPQAGWWRSFFSPIGLYTIMEGVIGHALPGNLQASYTKTCRILPTAVADICPSNALKRKHGQDQGPTALEPVGGPPRTHTASYTDSMCGHFSRQYINAEFLKKTGFLWPAISQHRKLD